VARTNATNFTGPLQFPYANAGTDIFKKEDVQTLAQAVDQHDHTTGKGLSIPAGAIPNGTITSAMIADGTIQGADIASGTITTTQIQDGTIATADLANAAVTNAKLGTDTARLNLLTNGGFEMWQRGNGPFTGNNFSADRWLTSLGGTSTLSVSRDTTNVDTSSLAAAALTYTHNASTDYSQKIEDYSQLRGRTVSLSVRVRTSTVNAVRLAIYDGSYHYGNYHSGGGAYETLNVTWAIPTGAAAILAAVVKLDASCTAYIDNAMLVVGSVAADYAPLHPADDLARCLRYYQRWDDTNTEIGMGASQNATSHIIMLPLAAGMAVSPSLTTSPAANLLLQNSTLTGSVAPSSLAASTLGKRVCSISAATGAAFNTAGSPVFLYTNTGWIAVEANP